MSFRDGLSSFFALDESSGTRADSVDSNSLTDVNTVTGAAGVAGGTAAQFTAANSETLTAAHNANLLATGNYLTVACWVYLDSKPGDMTLVTKETGGFTFEYGLTYSSFWGRYTFDVTPDGNFFGRTGVVSASVIPLATWCLVIAEHDAVLDTISIQLDDGAIVSTAYSVGIGNFSGGFRLGSYDSGSYLNGRLTNVLVWQSKVASDDRAWMFNRGVGRSKQEILDRIRINTTRTCEPLFPKFPINPNLARAGRTNRRTL